MIGGWLDERCGRGFAICVGGAPLGGRNRTTSSPVGVLAYCDDVVVRDSGGDVGVRPIDGGGDVGVRPIGGGVVVRDGVGGLSRLDARLITGRSPVAVRACAGVAVGPLTGLDARGRGTAVGPLVGLDARIETGDPVDERSRCSVAPSVG